MVPILDQLDELLPRLTSSDACPQLSVFSPGTDEGHLRGITLRTGTVNAESITVNATVNTDNATNVESNADITVKAESTDSAATGSLLMIVDIHPQNLDEIEIQKFADFLADYFTNNERGRQCGLTSLLLTTRRNNGDPLDMTTTRVIFGSPFIYERLMGLEFRVSFNAFFQGESGFVGAV